MELSFQLCSTRNTLIDAALKIVRDAGYRRVEACRDNVASGELFSRTDADSSFDLERFVQRSREAVKGFLA